MYISDQKNTCVCQCGADCLNIMERIKITGESQNKRRTKSKFRYSATVSWSRLSCGLVEHLLDRSGPARGFGYTVSWAISIQVYGIFWSKFGYKVFSFS